METTIKIGSVQIRDEDYAIQANAVLGIRGTGKTTLAKSIAEQMLDHKIPIIVFDPTGVWRYLKRAAKQGQRGYPIVVAGGVEPDLQLTPSSAAEIVRAAIKENVSLVIDLYDKKLSKGNWRSIVRDCFRTLMYENEGVRHIFLEEAAEFAPQRVQDGETYAEVEKVVRMGGNASLGITLINQRSQEVNKAVLELCENLILMRQRGSHAIDAIEKWIDKLEPEYAKTIKGELPNLATGRAFVFRGEGPPVAVSANKLHTFHPDRRRPEAIKRAGKSPDVDKFVSRLGERLKDKTVLDTVETLRARVKELEKGARSPTPTIDKVELQTAAQDVARYKKQAKGLEKQIERMKQAFNRAGLVILTDLPEELHVQEPQFATVLRPGLKEVHLKHTKALSDLVDNTFANAKPKVEGKRDRNYDTDNEGDLTGPQRAMLKSTYWLRNESNELPKLSFFAGYKPNRHAKDRLSELRSKGLLTPDNRPTELGEEIAAPLAGERPTGSQLRDKLRSMLTGPQNIVLDAIFEMQDSEIPGEEVTLETIAAMSGYTVNRHLKDRVSELRSVGIITGGLRGAPIKPSPMFD